MANIIDAISGLEWILKDDRFGFGKGLTKPETDEEQAGCYIHDALELLKEQEEMNIDAFMQWCTDSHIVGFATVSEIKYWVRKYKEGR